MNRDIRVLVVDDSEDDVLLLVDHLKDNGYAPEYVRVDNPEAMSRVLSEGSWDIIIADYKMPNFSGPEALRVLLETEQDIPLILVSGTAPDQTGIEMMRAGAKDYILKDNLSRLSAAVGREIAEAEGRRQRRKAEEALREAEAHRLEFYRRTILAATDGKLVICEGDEILSIAGKTIASWDVSDKQELSRIRDDVKRIALDQGMDESRVPYLLGCVMEAAANAIKHATGGHASLHRTNGALLFMISDTGPGIGAFALPDIALTRGYSTAGTLGMGYKVMINSADRIYLATDQNGTTVAAEMEIHPKVPGSNPLLKRLSGM